MGELGVKISNSLAAFPISNQLHFFNPTLRRNQPEEFRFGFACTYTNEVG
ncbi:MAG: hypothetical protein N3B10_05095 [Armatimonadetes bacterium]|nr:hypothetical protein [Armatimonadota bacterium]